MKNKNKNVKETNVCIAYGFGLMSAILCAIGNGIYAYQAQPDELGEYAIIPQFVSAIASFFLFHAVKSTLRKCRNDYEEPYFANYVSKKNEEIMIFNMRKAFPTISFTLLQIVTEGCVFACFYFLGQCEEPINSGIISSLFTCSIIWVALAFYCLYG